MECGEFSLARVKVASTDTEAGIQCSEQGAQCRVSLSGRITIDSSEDLRERLLKRLDDPSCQCLTVDFLEVTYIDTSGLAIMIETLRAARVRKKKFQLSRLQERPRYLLEATRLLHLFDEESAR
jgi:anti-sigma B factor antagonist